MLFFIFIYDPAIYKCCDDGCVAKFRFIEFENVLGKNDQIGKLTYFDTSLFFFLKFRKC